MKNILLFIISFGIYSKALSQNLPAEMSISADGKMLLSGTKRTTGLYDTSAIKNLKLYFTQTDYWTQLTNNYTTGKSLLARMTYDGVVFDSIGVDFKGQTSYSGVRNRDKKSFGISLDFVKNGQNLMGFETLNLNNAYQDESYMREVIYTTLARRHNPEVKGNFVHLYINDVDWGLYPNIQQVNGQFIREWWFSNDGTRWRADTPAGTTTGGGMGGGGFGRGTNGLNYLANGDSTEYKKNYSLKNTKVPFPWKSLVTLTEKLNKPALTDLEKELPTYLDIDRTMWMLATENGFGDDDGYVNKGGMDYYIYYDPETKRITPIEVDGNSALETSRASWNPFQNETNVNFPLMNRLFAVPYYRQKYLAHLRVINEESINPKRSHPLIDATAKQIDALVKSDPKALYTYTAFQSELPILKNFFTTRYNFLKNHAELNKIVPSISKTTFASNGKDNEQPNEKQTVWVRSTVNSTEGIAKVWLYYSDNLTGNFIKKEMLDDGKSNDGASKDGVFGAEIPTFAVGKYVRYYIEAVSANSVGTLSYDPIGAEHDVYLYQVQSSVPITKNVAINEIAASNLIHFDEAKDLEDWIELYNYSTASVDLSGYFLSDNPTQIKKWEIPKGTTIDSKGYLIIWADEEPKEGKLHANFKLSKSGETVLLANPSGVVIDQVSYGSVFDNEAHARVPNGTGNFKNQSMTFGSDNEKGVPISQNPVVNPPTTPTTPTTPTNPVVVTNLEEEQIQVKIYPNPSTDQLIIMVGNELIGKELNIFDTKGGLIHKQKLESKTSIETTNWSGGLYVLKMDKINRKVLIMR
jgi:spore coat protein CotH